MPDRCTTRRVERSVYSLLREGKLPPHVAHKKVLLGAAMLTAGHTEERQMQRRYRERGSTPAGSAILCTPRHTVNRRAVAY